MKRITLEQLTTVMAHLPPNPRVVASGNFAAPHALLRVLDEQVPEYTLHMLNAQPGIPDRDGVTFETCFVGPAMRHSPRLRYVPSRLSLVPVLYRGPLRPDAVIVHASAPRYDTVSLGIEVNVLPAAIEAARELGAPVIVQANPQMPYTYGDGQLYDTEIDYLVEVDEDFEILIDGQPINTLSGSGKAVANLAVRIALGQILTNKVFSVFFADEVDAAMDDDRSELMVLSWQKSFWPELSEILHAGVTAVVDSGLARELRFDIRNIGFDDIKGRYMWCLLPEEQRINLQ